MKNKSSDLLPAEELCKFFLLKDGNIFWKDRRPHQKSTPVTLGVVPAGSLASGGYKRVTINYRPYYIHRIVWAMTHGHWPQGIIDHINGDVSDNRPENLREATPSQNQLNQKRHRAGRMPGTYLRKKSGRWYAIVPKIPGNLPRATYIGSFCTRDEAGEAVQKYIKKVAYELEKKT